jgi:4-amino-4-deoxy-L-arabinose transferase-like glycosyltransferase
MIDFLLALCVALIAIAFIEWLKKPFPKAPFWVWWALAPLVSIGLGFVATLWPGAILGLLAFALATLFYDNVIQWAKKKIESLAPPPSGQ